MATQSYSTPIDHTSNAGFRAWGLEFSNALQAAGLLKKSDTGQIDWATVLRPSGGSLAGYEIFELSDSLSGSRPVYFKIEYLTSSYYEAPTIWITVGNGSNGSGTLTGQLSSRREATVEQGISSTTTNYQTYICVTSGFFGFLFKSNAGGTNARGHGYFAYARGTDDTGALIGDWGHAIWCNNSPNNQSTVEDFNYLTGQNYTITDGSQATIQGNVASSLVGTSIQLYTNYAVTPRVRPVWALFNVLESEAARGSTFSAIPVGNTVSHTYICLGSGTRYSSINSQANSNLAMVWE